MDDFYSLLEVAPTSTDDDIQRALRDKLRHWTRRANNAADLGERQKAERMVAQLSDAKRALGTPAARADYDRSRGLMPTTSSPQPSFTPVPSSPTWAPPSPMVPTHAPPMPGHPGPAPQPQRSAGTNRPWWLLGRKRPRRFTLVVLAAAVIIAIVAHGSGSGNTAKSAKWPSGATTAKVEAPVLAALKSCAQAATMNPSNCPQVDGSGAEPGLRWALHANPMSAARVSYSGGVFTVDGHALMTLQYDDSGGGVTLSVVQAPYEATVAWHAGSASLSSLGPLQDEPTPAIAYPQPAVSSAALNAAVRGQFATCLAAHGDPPPACPFHDAAPGKQNVAWRQVADPMLNSHVTFDNAYDVFHVSGSYSVTETWTGYDGSPASNPYGGNYDAAVTIDSGHPVVLQVKSA